MKLINFVFVMMFCLFYPAVGISGDWSDSSLSILSGSNFTGAGKIKEYRTEISFEHASGSSYGKQFFWLDVTDAQSGDTELYGEWSPSFNIGKFSQDSFVKQKYLSFTMEFGASGSSTSRSRLYGLGIALNIKNFSFFDYNLYVRDVLDVEGTTTQSTIAYKVPFSLANNSLSYSAYIDIVHGKEGTIEAHWHTGQQLLWNMNTLSSKLKDLSLGFEYQYWDKKFGNSSVFGKESNLKLMSKWQF